MNEEAFFKSSRNGIGARNTCCDLCRTCFCCGQLSYGENVFDPEGRVIMKQMADMLGVRFQPLFIRLRQFGLLDYHPLEELLMKQILES